MDGDSSRAKHKESKLQLWPQRGRLNAETWSRGSIVNEKKKNRGGESRGGKRKHKLSRSGSGLVQIAP